jgi:hypothetical protein
MDSMAKDPFRVTFWISPYPYNQTSLGLQKPKKKTDASTTSLQV